MSPSGTAVAALPMYRAPHLERAAESLWATLRSALEAEGLPTPHAPTTDRPRMDLWKDPDLILGHTCGLPFAVSLADRVNLVATPVYEVDGCAPGNYYSVLVVRADDPRESLTQYRCARAAYNERLSQSGYAALLTAVAPLAADGRFFTALTATGSHGASLATVAEGGADIAAIDAVTWRLSAPLSAAKRLRVLATTEPTPALPYIAAPRFQLAAVRRAVITGLDELDSDVAATYGLSGAVVFAPSEYAPLADRLARVELAVRGRVASDLIAGTTEATQLPS